MSDYAALLARLEAATEGSRELDEAIARFIGELPANAVFVVQNPEDGSEHYEWDVGERDEYGPIPGGAILKRRTRSLDAALTLVPEGWFWEIALGVPANTRSKIGAGPYWATLSPMDEKLIEKMRDAKQLSYDGDILSGAPTAALAACKTILRARQSLEEGK